MTDVAVLDKSPSPPTRQMSNVALVELIRPKIPALIEKAFQLVEKADNDSVKLGAIKLLMGKVIADLKSMDFQGELNADGSRPQIGLFINLGGGFVPLNVKSATTPIGSITELTQTVQDVSMAPQGTQDHNGDLRGGEAGTR